MIFAAQVYVSKHSHWTRHDEDRHQVMESTLTAAVCKSHEQQALFFILVSSININTVTTLILSASAHKKHQRKSYKAAVALTSHFPSFQSFSKSKKTSRTRSAKMQTSSQPQQQKVTPPLSLWIPESRAVTTTLATASTTNSNRCLRKLCELEINIHPDKIAALAEDIRLYDLLSAGDESGMNSLSFVMISSPSPWGKKERRPSSRMKVQTKRTPSTRRTRRKSQLISPSLVTETKSTLETRMETATRDLLDAGVFELFRPEEWIQGSSMGRKFVGVSALLFAMDWS